MSDGSESSSSQNHHNNNGSMSLISKDKRPINVRITLSCPNCKTKRVFKNVFTEDKMELLMVSVKVIDWMTCEKCGAMLESDLEFEV